MTATVFSDTREHAGRLNPFDMNLCGVLFVEMDEAANILMK